MENPQIFLEGFEPQEEHECSSFPIENYLMTGDKNIFAAEFLTLATGLSARRIKKAVQDARRRGVPIVSVSGSGGYYLAATEDEKQRCIRQMKSRLYQLSKTIAALERAEVMPK